MADEPKPIDGLKVALLKLAPSLIALVAGAVVALVSQWLGVKAPDAITVPVVVSAPALAADGVSCEARPRLVGLRARLHAEIDRRAALEAGSVWHIDAEKAREAHDLVGKLGDGHLLDLLIKYGPDIIALVIKILAMLAVL